MHHMKDKLLVRLLPELKALVDAEATRQGIHGGMGEMAVKILADYFERPDLARVPKKRMGRPPGPAKNGNGKHVSNGKPDKREPAAASA